MENTKEPINLRCCTEDEIVDEVSKRIITLATVCGLDYDYQIKEKELKNLASHVKDELIETYVFYDYDSNEKGDVYCLSLPEDIIDKDFLETNVTKKEEEYLNQMILHEIAIHTLKGIFDCKEITLKGTK